MKKLLIVFPLCLALLASGCLKMNSETAIKGDGSATMKFSMGYKLDAVEKIKSQIPGGGEEDDDSPGPGKAFHDGMAKMNDALDAKKMSEKFKSYGLEVSKAESGDKDGWKMLTIEASTKNLAETYKKMAASPDMAEAAKPMKELGMGPAGFMPHFYKTDKADVATVSLIPPLGPLLDQLPQNPLEAIENMDDEQREQVEGFVEQFRTMLSLDELKFEIKIKVPGKILSVQGAKKDGDDGFAFSLLGKDMSLDSVKTLFGLKSGVSATFQFDPATFKLVLEDAPKAAESKPASRPAAEKPKANEDETKKKKEDEGEGKKKEKE